MMLSKIPTKSLYYVVFVLCGLLLWEHQFVVFILITAVFLLYCYPWQWELIVCDHQCFLNCIRKIVSVCCQFLKFMLIKMVKDKPGMKETLEEQSPADQCKVQPCSEKRKCEFLLMLSGKVWQKIFGELKDSKDVMSCYYTCNLFHALLETRIKAEVFLVLQRYSEKYAGCRWLQNDDILNCRLVSASWKLSIDYFLQHNQSHMNFLGHLFPTTVIDSNDSRHVEGLIQRLIRNYNLKNTNPFPSRHMQLRIHSDLSEFEGKIFFTAMSILMKYFGKHLWYFTIYIDDTDNDGVTAFRSMCELLGQTPCLKMISLCFRGNPDKKNGKLGNNFVEDAVVTTAFRNLKELRALKLENVHDFIKNTALKQTQSINLENLEVVPSTA